jgi:hypothetical protein
MTLRVFLAVSLMFALISPSTAAKPVIKLVSVATNALNPIGVEWHEYSNTVLFSLHYSDGEPFNFARLTQSATFEQFSQIHGLSDEVYMASPRSGPNVAAGFTAGDVFTGNGQDGEVLRISFDGSSSSLFATLRDPSNPTGSVGLLRGGLQFDQTGVWGGNLLVVTTLGYVFVVHSNGLFELVTHFDLGANGVSETEGVTVVPNDVNKFGVFAGNILTGFDQQPDMLACTPARVCTRHTVSNVDPNDSPSTWSFEGFHVADGGNFYGCDFVNNRVLAASADDFAAQGMEGDLIFSQENGLLSRFVVTAQGEAKFEQILYDPSGETPGQWEGTTFAYAGVGTIQPAVVPSPELSCSPTLASPDCMSVVISSDSNSVGVEFGEGGICPTPTSCVPVAGQLSSLFYTQFGGVSRNVNKVGVNVQYGSTPSVSFGPFDNVASVGGNADGIVRNTDFVYIGNANAINRVNTVTSAVNNYNGCSDVTAYHLKITTFNSVTYLIATSITASIQSACFFVINSDGSLGSPMSVPVYLTSSPTTRVHLTTVIDSPLGYYYTADTSGSGGSTGSFGQMTIAADLSRISLSPISNAPCVHSRQWDPFSSTLLTWGNTHVCQTTVNLSTGVFSPSDVDVYDAAPGLPSTPNFDQGTVDGLGNLFIADNNGHLWYSLYKNTAGAKIKLGAQGFGFGAVNFDDVAPLIGAGSSCN